MKFGASGPPAMGHPGPARTLFCGFGEVSEAASVVMVRRGQSLGLKVMTADIRRSDSARALGLPVLQVRALTAEGIAEQIGSVATLILEPGDDPGLALLLLSLRPRFPEIRMIAVPADPGATPALLRCGATEVLSRARIAGLLLAAAASGTSKAQYRPPPGAQGRR